MQVTYISIPGLEAARLAQLLTIGAELASAYKGSLAEHCTQLNCDTQITLALAGAFSAIDLLEVRDALTELKCPAC